MSSRRSTSPASARASGVISEIGRVVAVIGGRACNGSARKGNFGFACRLSPTSLLAPRMTPEFGSSRTAIVTGGARRLGAAFARGLAADGWTLLIHYGDSHDEAATLAAELGGATRIVRAD